MRLNTLTALLATLPLLSPVLAQDKVLNLYSARHYPTDEALYSAKKGGRDRHCQR